MGTLHMLHTLDTEVGNLGVTIRNGLKWFEKTGPIDLCVCVPEHHIAGHGQIEFTKKYVFRDIPAKFLEFEHEEMSRVYSGLLTSMKRAYGDSFTEDALVTVLGYRRID